MLVERARSLGWSKLVTNGILLSNERALRMFESAGFVRAGPVEHDEKGNETVRMEKVLQGGGDPTAPLPPRSSWMALLTHP